MDKDDWLTMVYHFSPCLMFMVLQGRWLGPKHMHSVQQNRNPTVRTLSSIIKQINEICQRTTFPVTNIYKG